MVNLNPQLTSSQPVLYPPAPWHMHGQLYGSIWLVPAKQVKVELPAQLKSVINLGYMGVYAGFVDYQQGSPLEYHELIAGVLVRQRGKLRFGLTVTHIWVDSVPSLHGGRDIWGVPKELAEFKYSALLDNHDFRGVAHASGTKLAQGKFRSVVGMPKGWKMPIPFPNLQMLHGHPVATSGTFFSTFQLSRGGMEIPAESPLAALGISGRKPLISFSGLDFSMPLQAPKPV